MPRALQNGGAQRLATHLVIRLRCLPHIDTQSSLEDCTLQSMHGRLASRLCVLRFPNPSVSGLSVSSKLRLCVLSLCSRQCPFKLCSVTTTLEAVLIFGLVLQLWHPSSACIRVFKPVGQRTSIDSVLRLAPARSRMGSFQALQNLSDSLEGLNLHEEGKRQANAFRLSLARITVWKQMSFGRQSEPLVSREPR